MCIKGLYVWEKEIYYIERKDQRPAGVVFLGGLTAGLGFMIKRS